MSKLDIKYINQKIKEGIDYEIINNLKDESLKEIYINSKSVKCRINILKKLLEKYNISEKIIEKIIDDYILELIPAGTKGTIRGNKFNDYVKKNILEMNLDKKIYDYKFEKNINDVETNEVPDWYIIHKKNKKIIIGMNQLALWGGGQQINRGLKYIKNNIHNTQDTKLLCVVCNDVELKSDKNKIYELFDLGFRNNTLCYLNNLNKIIIEYFKE